MLAGKQTEIEKRAGIENLSQFTFYNTVNALADGDVLKWQTILNLPYDQFFLKLYLNKVKFEFDEKFLELSTKNAKP